MFCNSSFRRILHNSFSFTGQDIFALHVHSRIIYDGADTLVFAMSGEVCLLTEKTTFFVVVNSLFTGLGGISLCSHPITI
jgi:hypothetical protein